MYSVELCPILYISYFETIGMTQILKIGTFMDTVYINDILILNYICAKSFLLLRSEAYIHIFHLQYILLKTSMDPKSGLEGYEPIKPK